MGWFRLPAFLSAFPFPFKKGSKSRKVHPENTPPEESARLCETLMKACEASSAFEGTITLYAYHEDTRVPAPKSKMTIRFPTHEWPSFEHQEKLMALAAHPMYWHHMIVELESADPKESCAMHIAFQKAIGSYRLLTSMPHILVVSTALLDTHAIPKVATP